jgi:hypothetical protein
VWLDHAEIAIGVIFSTAVAALSLHLGVTIATSPHSVRPRREGHGFDVMNPHESAGTHASANALPSRFGAVRGSRAWAMLLPVGFLALMAGFSGKLTLTHALLFAIQGLFVVMVWTDAAPRSMRPGGLPSAARAQLALSLTLALIGGICAVYGATRLSQETGIMSTGLIASAALGPLLVLPMIGSASLLAAHGEAQTAVGASVVIVLLNLCLLLPLVILGWHVRENYFPSASTTMAAAAAAPSRPARQVTTRPATTRATTEPVAEDDFGADEPPLPDDMPRVLSFPIAVWRIDTVLLILLGLILLPVSLNLWEMRRSEGIVLVVIYACYLIVTTVLGRRW